MSLAKFYASKLKKPTENIVNEQEQHDSEIPSSGEMNEVNKLYKYQDVTTNFQSIFNQAIKNESYAVFQQLKSNVTHIKSIDLNAQAKDYGDFEVEALESGLSKYFYTTTEGKPVRKTRVDEVELDGKYGSPPIQYTSQYEDTIIKYKYNNKHSTSFEDKERDEFMYDIERMKNEN